MWKGDDGEEKQCAEGAKRPRTILDIFIQVICKCTHIELNIFKMMQNYRNDAGGVPLEARGSTLEASRGCKNKPERPHKNAERVLGRSNELTR